MEAPAVEVGKGNGRGIKVRVYVDDFLGWSWRVDEAQDGDPRVVGWHVNLGLVLDSPLVTFRVLGGGPLIGFRICFLPDDVDGLVGEKALGLIKVGTVTCPVCSNHCSVCKKHNNKFSS